MENGRFANAEVCVSWISLSVKSVFSCGIYVGRVYFGDGVQNQIVWLGGKLSGNKLSYHHGFFLLRLSFWCFLIAVACVENFTHIRFSIFLPGSNISLNFLFLENMQTLATDISSTRQRIRNLMADS